MGKYTMFSTREDWDKLYAEVEKAGFDLTYFKKSQSFDMASATLSAMKRQQLKKEDN